MSGPLVSVVVPTYNRAGFVETAVASLLEQDYEALEVIALDDGSADETPAVLERIAERTDPARFRWSRHENVGQAATINRGFAQARGELLGYLSSDDYLLPGAISRLVGVAEGEPDVEVVYPWFHVVDESDRVVDTIACLEHSLRDALRWALCMPGVGALMRRRCYERIGGWDERYGFCPDFEWWIRARDARFRVVREPLGAWRAHEGSISTGALDLGYVHELLRVLDDLYADERLAPELLEIKHDAYASAYALGSAVLRRGRSDTDPDHRFVIEDRLAARFSHLAAKLSSDEVVGLRTAYRAADRERVALRELIEEQRRTIEALQALTREQGIDLAPRRPAFVRVGRALTPPALRPRVGAAVHRLRSR